MANALGMYVQYYELFSVRLWSSLGIEPWSDWASPTRILYWCWRMTRLVTCEISFLAAYMPILGDIWIFMVTTSRLTIVAMKWLLRISFGCSLVVLFKHWGRIDLIVKQGEWNPLSLDPSVSWPTSAPTFSCIWLAMVETNFSSFRTTRRSVLSTSQTPLNKCIKRSGTLPTTSALILSFIVSCQLQRDFLHDRYLSS